mgnify:CR=1 FL=1
MYKKNIRLLKIFNFLIGFSLFAPLAIIYFSKVSGSYALGASIFGINALASALFEVPTGVWSDRMGRRGTIIMGSWARVTAFVLYAIGLSYWWLVVGAILEGLSRSLYSGNNDAFLHDTLADDGMEEEYDEYLGKTSSTEQLALGLSGVLGAIIGNFSFLYLMWLSVIAQVYMLYISYQFIEPKTRAIRNSNIYSHVREAIKLFITNKKLRLLSMSSFLGFGLGETSYQFRSAFISTLWPIWAIGLTSLITNVSASISFWYSGKLVRRFNEFKILLFGSVYGKVISLVAYAVPTILSPLLLTTMGLLYGVTEVSKNKLMQLEFTDHQRATMSSLNSLFGNVTFSIIFIVLGIFADSIGPAKALILLTLASISTTYIYYLLFKNDDKIKA